MADDHRAALIAYTVARSNYFKGRKPKFADFILEWGGKVEPKRLTGDELLRKFKAFDAGRRPGG